MKITFLGAAKSVTGSRHLLEANGSRVLIDCGLYQERAYRGRNWERFPVDPSSINSVLLTHAHIDHCGYLPKLVREGFGGKIFCTAPTEDISKIALLDTAHLQETDAEQKRMRHRAEGRKPLFPEIPLYTIEDARNIFGLFKAVPYGSEIEAAPGIKCVFHDAGHILGSSMLEITVTENKVEKKLIFSGDIGRWEKPLLNDPHLFKEGDFIFMESTYGDRSHHDTGKSAAELAGIINDTVKRGGNLVIPTFATERAQLILYYLNALLSKDSIPNLLTLLDSPMAIEVTKVFRKYPDFFDSEARELIKSGDTIFDFPLLKATASIQESKAINRIKGTTIILAGSGMCTGGRIKHHLANNLERLESTILFTSYQAEGTLGRELIERPRSIRLFGQNVEVKARIEKLNGFSAHADREELLKWIAGFAKTPEKVFIIHGEEKAAAGLAEALKGRLKSEIIIGEYRKEYILS